MKADKIFIIVMGAKIDDEIKGAAVALLTRYRGEKKGHAPGGAQILHIKNDYAGAILSLKSGGVEFWNDQAAPMEAGQAVKPGGKVGVYIICHAGPTGLQANHSSADHVALLLSRLNLGDLYKVVLLACNAGRSASGKVKPFKGQEQRDANGAEQETFLYKLCHELTKGTNQPIVIGWDSFVTVCSPGAAKFMPAGMDAGADSGKKIYGNVAKQYSPAADATTRSKHRMVYKSGGQTIMRWHPDSWSDKEKT